MCIRDRKYTGSVSVNFEIKEMKTYEQTLVTGNSWLTISNEYYDSDEGEYKFDWEYSDKDQLIAESNDSSVCKVLKVYGCLLYTSVKDGDQTLVEGQDYTVSYANNVNVGTASVTVTGNGTTYTLSLIHI